MLKSAHLELQLSNAKPNLLITFPDLIKVQLISQLSWKKNALQPLTVLCSSASVLVFKALLVAEDTLQIALHLISSLFPRYLPQHHRAANGKWAGASIQRLRRTRKHRRHSLNHALTTWSFLSPSPPSISPAAAYRWGHKLIIGMSSAHGDT